jgi:hypothetical protein
MGSATSSLRSALTALRKEHAKTERAIAAIEDLLRDMDDGEQPAATHTEPLFDNQPQAYAGMTIGEAATAFLRTMGRPQNTAAIVKALWAGGIKSESKSPYRMMYNILANRLEKDVVKLGSEWGLKEWGQK